MKRVLKRLALAGFSAVVVLLAFEVLLRAFPDRFEFVPAPSDYMPHVFVEDPDITWTMAPNATATHRHLRGDFRVRVTTDARGMRRSGTFDAQRPNLLVLGDSFAFGFGVEDHETFPARLAELMPEFNVMNAGYTSGMSLDTQYVYLRRHVDELRPKVVLVQFFAGNDFADMAANEWIPAGAELPQRVITPYRAAGRRGVLVFRRHGWLVRIAPAIRRTSWAGAFLMDRLSEFCAAASRPPPSAPAGPFAPPREAEACRLVAALRRLADERGFDLLFVVLPAGFEDDNWSPRLGPMTEGIERCLVESGVPHVTIASLRNLTRLPVRFPHDGHLTAEGNRLLASRIEPFVRGHIRSGSE